jgi:CRISPR-associated HD domain protein
MKIKGIDIYAKSNPPYSLDEHTKDVLLSLNDLAVSLETYEGYSRDVYDNYFWENVFFSTIFHDIGKIDYRFQKMISSSINPNSTNQNLEKLKPVSCKLTPPEQRHNVVSYIYLNYVSIALQKEPDLQNLFSVSALISLLHHLEPLYQDLLYSESDPSYPSNLLNNKIKNDDVEYYKCFFRENVEEIAKNYAEVLREVKDEITHEHLKNAATLAEKIFLNEQNKLKNNNIDSDSLILTYSQKELLKNNKKLIRIILGFLMRVDHFSSGKIGLPSAKIDLGPQNISSFVINELRKKAGNSIWQEDLLQRINGGNICLIAPTGSGKPNLQFLEMVRER